MTRSLLRLSTLAALICPPSLSAQTVNGLVLLPDSVTPAAHVLVELRAVAGSPSRVLTDTKGRFAFRLRAPDTVTLRAMRPGLRPTVAAPRFIAAGKVLDLRLVLGTDRVTLAAVTVTATENRICGSSKDGAAFQLWNEARTVLHSTVLTERDTALQIRAIEYEGRPDAGGSVQMTDSTLRVVPLGEAFGVAHYDSLFRFGYIRRNSPGVTTYNAPNAQLLADERFVSQHCFRMAPDDTLADDLVGIRFEPGFRPRYTGVAGTLWLDVATYKLRRIEFEYVNPPLHHRTEGTGGSIEFTELSTSHWITQNWTILMSNPVAGIVFASAGSTGAARRSGMLTEDYALWARRQVVFQVTLDESLLMRDSAADQLARRVPVAGGR